MKIFNIALLACLLAYDEQCQIVGGDDDKLPDRLAKMVNRFTPLIALRDEANTDVFH